MYMIRENDDDALNLLLNKYQPIILKYANKYYKIGKNYGLELDDFIQEGNYALFCAIKNYSEYKNSLFYTYAVISIKSKMQNIITNNNNGKHISLNSAVSLDANVTEDNVLSDYIPSSLISPELEIENIELERIIYSYLYELPLDKASIFELKLNGFTNKEIGILLDISYSTVGIRLNKIRKNINLIELLT